MTGTKLRPTKAQEWFRTYSALLAASFCGSARIAHNVTKGESREYQVLDTLRDVLPERVSVERGVVIVDASGAESKKFDGVLLDRTSWPRLFQRGPAIVAMIESVVAVIEVKSSLNRTELRDILGKARALRTLRCANSVPIRPPPVVAFAYECPNANLSFFDFAAAFHADPSHAPSVVCVLDRCLFTLARSDGEVLRAEEVPAAHHVPVLLKADGDTLLILVYILSRWASTGTDAADIFLTYSLPLFRGLTAFHFDEDFLDAISSGGDSLTRARQCFTRKPSANINHLYLLARDRLGLDTLA